MNSGSSSSLETKTADAAGVKSLSIALIGPNERRRWDVSSVLADCRGVTVREFSSYPTAIEDVPKLLERYFDVILVDLDSDPEFVLKLVANICAESTASVMVYSEKADRELMIRCTKAGASECLVQPMSQSTLTDVLDRVRIGLHARASFRSKTLGDLLVFFGAKGGTGVTTIACNLAIALAQQPGHKTLLIDLAVPLGDAALNLGIAAEYSTDNVFRDIARLDGRLLQTLVARHRSGVFVLAAPSTVPQVEASKADVDKLVSVARQQFEHVIVDVGSRIDLMDTDLFQKASTIYLVTQAGISELRNSNRLISQFFSEGGPNLEVVLNRFAPHLQAGVNEDVITKALGRPVRWKIPDDHDATRHMQSTSTVLSPADSAISQLILEIARSVTGHPIPPAPHERSFIDEVSESNGKPVSQELASDEPASDERASDGPQIEGKDQLSSNVQALEHAVPAPAEVYVAPAITWQAPDPISYGAALSSVQLNATASVPGTLAYTPGLGYVLPAGTHTLWVTFIPANAAGGAPVQAAVSIAVSKAIPDIAWPAPPDIANGTELSATHLNATTSVPGKFDYRPSAGEVLPVGTHSLSVTFTPDDAVNYTTAEASVPVSVARLTPALEWPKPDPIVYGEALSAAQLNATTSTPGELVYHPSAGEVLGVGTHTLTVKLNPADQAQYSEAEAAVTITVAKATPAIAWQQPGPIVYGAALGNAHLDATASVPGTFTYNPCAGAMLAAGEHTPSVLFTPADAANYEPAQASVRLTVAKETPVVSWSAPESIPSGSALGDVQLNATATVPGTFTYSPAAGEALAPGSHRLSVEFTPADSLNYTSAQEIVWVTVFETSPAEIAWHAPAAISYGTPLGDAQLNATSSVQGTFVYVPAAGHVLAPGRYTLSAAFTPADPGKYATAQAAVELVVEEPVSFVIEHEASEPASFEPAEAAKENAPSITEEEAATASATYPQNTHRETRTYRGAVYEKGEDGQWHLQQK